MTVATSSSAPQSAPTAPRWGSVEHLEELRQQFMGKYGHRLGELATWQQQLLDGPVSTEAPLSYQQRCHKAMQLALELFKGLRPHAVPTPPPRKAAQRREAVPAVASDHVATVSVLHRTFVSVATPTPKAVAPTRPTRKVDTNGYGREHPMTAEQIAQSEAALAVKRGPHVGSPNPQVRALHRGAAVPQDKRNGVSKSKRKK